MEDAEIHQLAKQLREHDESSAADIMEKMLDKIHQLQLANVAMLEALLAAAKLGATLAQIIVADKEKERP